MTLVLFVNASSLLQAALSFTGMLRSNFPMVAVDEGSTQVGEATEGQQVAGGSGEMVGRRVMAHESSKVAVDEGSTQVGQEAARLDRGHGVQGDWGTLEK